MGVDVSILMPVYNEVLHLEEALKVFLSRVKSFLLRSSVLMIFLRMGRGS